MTDSQKTGVSIAVVGCGYWGKNLVRNFHTIGNLAAVCDPNKDFATTMADQYGVPAMSWEEVLASDSIKAVALAVPAEMHVSMAMSAIEAGKHVYVEKPIALDVDEAQKLVDYAKSENKTLMVGHLLQYHPVFLKLKKMIKDGAIGKLQYIYSSRLSLGKFRSEENILWSFAPHDISMILGLVEQEPNKVTAIGHNFLQNEIADTTITHMTFPSGIAAHIFVSWLHPYKEQRLVVTGEDGMLVFDDAKPWEEKLSHFAHKVDWSTGSPLPLKADPNYVSVEQDEPLKNECLHFVDCVTNGTTPRTDGHEGLRVLKVLDAATKSLQAGS